MQKEKVLQVLLIVSRFILGLVFIFSGFVKGLDPMGSVYKFTDYFNAFNLSFLDPLAIFLAFVMISLEFLIGVSLIFRFRFQLGAWAVTVFMSFFTVLTLILALTNPVTDCGCFGDAIIMTNWQTFFKNILLLPFVFMVFFYRRDQAEPWTAFYSLGSLLVFGFLFLALEVQAYRHLPQIDFRPYSLGTHIPDKMTIPEGAQQDEYQTLLYYEKDGNIQEFTEENFPWEDTAWTYVDSRHTLISKGYEPPIHDFTIVDEYGDDITNDVLADRGFSFLLVTTHIGKANRKALIYADELASWAVANDHSFYCMTSSVDEDIVQAREEMNLGFGIYTTDEITLKTIIRSNPGLLLIQNGTILGKWHYNDFPAIEEMYQGLTPFVMNGLRKDIEKRSLGIFMALFLIISAFIVYSPSEETTVDSVAAYLLKKILYGILVAWGVISIVFLLFHVLPGDPARMMAGQRTDEATLQRIREDLGLDRPVHVQYLGYLNELSPLSLHDSVNADSFIFLDREKYGGTIALIRFSKHRTLVLKSPYLGRSFQSREKVGRILLQALPNTFILAFCSMFFAFILGTTAGIFAAVWKDGIYDRTILVVSSLGMSLPSFFAAVLMGWLFAYKLQDITGLNLTGNLFEVDTFGTGIHLRLKNLILPALTLGIRPLSVVVQLSRNSMLEVLSQDYIRTARAKGLSFYRIIRKHALKNSMNPVITAVSGWFASLMAGVIFVEYIFGWRGLGYIIVNALNNYDFPLVLGSVILISLIFVLINILVDLVYSKLDPRIQFA